MKENNDEKKEEIMENKNEEENEMKNEEKSEEKNELKDKEKNEFKNINLKLEAYGKGDYRLLRYLPDGSCVFEETPNEENKNRNNLQQYAQIFCSAMDKMNRIKNKDDNMRNNKEWGKGEEYRILVENELKELMVLFDMLLGTLNYDKGQKYLSLNKCLYYKDAEENKQALSIAVTSRKHILEKLRNLCEKTRIEINSINGTITQKYFLCFINQLIKHWKILNKKYAEIDYMQLDNNFPYMTQITVEFYFLPSYFWQLSSNPIFLSWPPHPSFSPFKSQYAHITFSFNNLEKDDSNMLYKSNSKEMEESFLKHKSREIYRKQDVLSEYKEVNLGKKHEKIKDMADNEIEKANKNTEDNGSFNKNTFSKNNINDTHDKNISMNKIIQEEVNIESNNIVESEHAVCIEENLENNKIHNKYNEEEIYENKEKYNKSNDIEKIKNWSFFSSNIKKEEIKMFNLLDNTSIINVQFEGIAANLIENSYFVQFDLYPLNIKLKNSRKDTKKKKYEEHIFPDEIMPENIIFKQAQKVHEKLTRAQWVLIDKSIFCILAEQANNLKDKNNELVINLDNIPGMNKKIKIHCTQINHKSIEFLLHGICIPTSSNKFISVDFSFVILYEPKKSRDTNVDQSDNDINNDTYNSINNNKYNISKNNNNVNNIVNSNINNNDNNDNVNNIDGGDGEHYLDSELIQMFLNLALSKIRDLFICSWKYFSFELPFYSADIHPLIYQNMFPDFRSNTLITTFFFWFIKAMNIYLRINEKKKKLEIYE